MTVTHSWKHLKDDYYIRYYCCHSIRICSFSIAKVENVVLHFCTALYVKVIKRRTEHRTSHNNIFDFSYYISF